MKDAAAAAAAAAAEASPARRPPPEQMGQIFLPAPDERQHGGGRTTLEARSLSLVCVVSYFLNLLPSGGGGRRRYLFACRHRGEEFFGRVEADGEGGRAQTVSSATFFTTLALI